MQGNDTLPAEAREEGRAGVFGIGGEGREVHHDKIRKGKECKRDRKYEETMGLASLQDIGNGRKHIRQMRSEQEFTEPTIDEAKWRNGVGKYDEDG